MTTSRFPTPYVAGHCDSGADLAPILVEASSRGCIPPLRDLAQDEFEMVGVGPAMTRLRMQIQRIGPHFRTVVVSGEAGTGKELAARALHRLSQGAAGPFVVGHAGKPSTKSFDRNRSAASSVDIDRMVTMAHGGTLFFDGVGEMPLQTQTHLLRVLRRQDGSQTGLATSQKIDLRMIASTREDLRVLTSTGRFLQELYQRLAMVEIALPPLRERREDISHLAMFFLARLALRSGKSVKEIDEDAMKRLEAHPWPGNVRELENALRHAVLQCEGTALEAANLPELAAPNAVESGMADTFGTARLQDVVERHVQRVLKNCAGNKLRAAEMLGISRSTLYRMLEARSYADGTTVQSRSARDIKEERYTR
jgi:DNA-binding NtrC family response regulator